MPKRPRHIKRTVAQIQRALTFEQCEQVERLYLAGHSLPSISSSLSLPPDVVSRHVRRVLIQTEEMGVVAFKGLLAVRLCGALDRHHATVGPLAAESVRVASALSAIDAILLGLGFHVKHSALVLQVQTDAKTGDVLPGDAIAEHLLRLLGWDTGVLLRAISLCKARRDLLSQAQALGVSMLKADVSLADGLGKMGVAALRRESTDPEPPHGPPNRKISQLLPDHGVVGQELLESEIVASRKRFEDHMSKQEVEGEKEEA